MSCSASAISALWFNKPIGHGDGESARQEHLVLEGCARFAGDDDLAFFFGGSRDYPNDEVGIEVFREPPLHLGSDLIFGHVIVARQDLPWPNWGLPEA